MSRFPLLFAMMCPVALWAAGVPWPVAKSTQEALSVPPTEALIKSLRAESDAAFDRRDFAAACALRRLESFSRFAAAHALPDSLRGWFLENRAFAEEFISLLSPQDDSAAVASILGQLWTSDEAAFRKYPGLACAIALVYDKPCPSGFPHHQVKPIALPRRLNPPVEVFRFFCEAAAGGRLIQSPTRLAIDELAFVVPVLAPLAELREAHRGRLSRADIPKLYPAIAYDHARLKAAVYVWPYESYSLETIRKRGGICVDQAYYTTTMAQAYGVPAFILSGAGNEGFHAFTGYLERPGKWRMDVGRYPGQKYATGEVINPLNWGVMTDHDLEFLEARFLNTPLYSAVLLHVTRAHEFMATKDFVTAQKLLDTAKRMEPRSPEVWESAAQLAEARGDTPQLRLALYMEAAKALSRYRELEIHWRTQAAAALDAMGKPEEALSERLVIIRRNAEARPDLAVELASMVMEGVMKEGNPKRTVSVFNKLAGQFTDAGPDFYGKVVFGVVGHLNEKGLRADAVKLVRSVNQKFKTKPDSQLAEMQRKATAMVESNPAFKN